MTDSFYIDTSCLLKLIILERESAEVHAICRSSNDIVISSLAELESRSRLLAFRRGGSLRQDAYRRATRDLERLWTKLPFRFERLGGDVFDVAIKQLKEQKAMACRTLDRLHLAAMHVLGVKSILTKDVRQAAVAKSLGFEVIG